MLDGLRNRFGKNRRMNELEKQILELSEGLLNKLATLSEMKENYIRFKRECMPRDTLKKLKEELRNMRRSITVPISAPGENAYKIRHEACKTSSSVILFETERRKGPKPQR